MCVYPHSCELSRPRRNCILVGVYHSLPYVTSNPIFSQASSRSLGIPSLLGRVARTSLAAPGSQAATADIVLLTM